MMKMLVLFSIKSAISEFCQLLKWSATNWQLSMFCVSERYLAEAAGVHEWFEPREKSHRQLYTCDECGKSFNWRSHLDSHKRMHSGIKPFVCAFCKKGFTQKGHMKRHIFTTHLDVQQAVDYMKRHTTQNWIQNKTWRQFIWNVKTYFLFCINLYIFYGTSFFFFFFILYGNEFYFYRFLSMCKLMIP